MNLTLNNVASWDLEYSEINELRYAAIRTLEDYCWNPKLMCEDGKCCMRTGCRIFFIHDAICKLGVDDQTWDALRRWADNYYGRHPRS